MYISQLLDGILCRFLLSPFDLCCSLTLKFVDFFLDDLSIDKNVVLKSHSDIVSGPIFTFMSSSVYFMKLGSQIFGAYIYNFYIFLMDCSLH
jgi:hypothetical protein